jgi:hypothetical protein
MKINKYIIINGSPVLFSQNIIHADMVSEQDNVDSAGFFLIRKDKGSQQLKVVCMGESTSLSVASRPEMDQQLILNYLGLNK